MDHALTIVLGLLVQLFDLVMAAIAFIEGGARHLLSRVGITGPLQGALLIVLAVLLVVAAPARVRAAVRRAAADRAGAGAAARSGRWATGGEGVETQKPPPARSGPAAVRQYTRSS